MSPRQRFSKQVLALLRDGKIVGIRAGTEEHRYTGVWVVVVNGRVFVRAWNDKPRGWRQAFREKPHGAIHVSGREIAVRARRVTGERLMEAIDFAYREKYSTPASRKWVRGFARARRRMTTTELLPLSAAHPQRRARSAPTISRT